jgi:two-component system NtrC family sensor kinase
MPSSTHEWGLGAAADAREMAALARERDDLLLLSEALVDVEAARTTDSRLSILECAIQRLGFRRVRTAELFDAVSSDAPAATISNSVLTDAGDLVVPLRAVDGTQLAALVLGDSVEPDAFSPSRVRMVELFAQQVASIIENARLYEESQRERGRGDALADIARAINGSLRLSEVLEIGLRHAMELLGSEAASIGLVRGDRIVLIANAGASAAEFGLEIPLDSSVSGRAIRAGRAVIVNDVGAIVGYRQRSAFVNIERIVVAPLVSGSGPIGTLTVMNRTTPFSADDGDVLQRLADQIVVAIANARLYEEVSETAERHRRAVEDERRAREVAAQSDERYARLVEAAFDAIFTVDHEGRITSANHSLEHACGKSREALLGTPAVELVDARDRHVALQAFNDAMSGVPQRAQVRYTDWSGATATCSLTLTPLSEGGRIAGSICIVRDVTEELRITEQLLQQEKLAAVGELVSGVAHELNNPLASVMAFAQLLLTEPEGERTNREALEAIHQEAKRAAKIVANLLTFARQHQPERAPTDLNRVVEDTLELRRYSLRSAQVSIVVRLDPAMPPTMADAFQLQQVVLNLLANAEHALSSWTGERVITLSTCSDGDLLKISVADTGPGIAPDHLSRVFNPFFTTKPVGEGTGLGLSISDGIVREHGGRIRVESKPGTGAAFVVELPRTAPPATSSAQASAVRPMENQGIASKRLLVIDDEPGLRQALTIYFQARGHVVDSAANAADGMRLASGGEYDALLLDLRLPDADGDNLLRELERIGRAPRRIVFATGDPESAAARAVSSAGYAVIGKPFALNSVASVLLAPAG